MGTADLVTAGIFSVLALTAGASLLYTWMDVERDNDHLLGVPMMSTIAGVGAFSVILVITSLATLPAWLRVLLALVAGAIAGVGSRNLWHDKNMLLINTRQNRSAESATDGESSPSS